MFIDFLIAAVFISSSLSLGSTSSSCGNPSSFVAFPLCKSRRRCCGFQTSAWRRSTSYCLFLRGWKLCYCDPVYWFMTPHFSPPRSASDTSSVSSSPLLGVTSDGWVTKAARQRLISTCKLSLAHFPFDTQRCQFTFTSYSSYGDGRNVHLLDQISKWRVSDVRNKKNDSVSFFSCAKQTDHSLSLQGFRNKSELTTIFAQIMVTRGEWALKDLNVTPCNTSEKCEDYVRYEVKETHFLPHVRPSLVFSFSSHPVTTTEKLTQLHFKEQQLE